MAIGLKFYREQKTPSFADTHGTEEFTLLLNNLFDALNAKIPVEGIRPNSRQIRVSCIKAAEATQQNDSLIRIHKMSS